MPLPMQEAISAFIAEHHVEQVFVKRKRDRANPEALGRSHASPTRGSQMSDQEKFLTRWSRRKRDTAKAEVEKPTAPAADDSTKQEIKSDESIVTRPRESEAPPAPGFDLTKLPSLEFDRR